MVSSPIRAGGITALAGVANTLIGISTGVLAARLLGPEGRGYVGAIAFWPSVIAGLGLLSLPESVVYHGARSNDEARLNGSTVLALAFTSALTVVFALALRHLFARSLPSALESTAILFTVLFVPSNQLSLTLGAIDQGRRRFVTFNLFRVLPQGGYLLAFLLLIVLDSVRVDTVVLASTVGTILLALVRLVGLAATDMLKRPDLRTTRLLILSGLKLHVAYIASVAGRQLDRLYVLVLFEANQVGLYFAAVMVASAPVNVINMALGVVAFPYLAAAPRSYRAVVMTKLVQVAMISSTVIGVAVAVVAPMLVPLALGEDYRAAVPIVIAHAIALLPLTLHVVIVGAMRGLQMWRTRTLLEALQALGFVVCAIPLARQFGVVGMPMAQAAVTVLTSTIAILLLIKEGYLSGLKWWGLGPAGVRVVIESLKTRSVK